MICGTRRPRKSRTQDFRDGPLLARAKPLRTGSCIRARSRSCHQSAARRHFHGCRRRGYRLWTGHFAPSLSRPILLSAVVTFGSRMAHLDSPKIPRLTRSYCCPRLACAAGVSNGSWDRGSAQRGASSSFHSSAFFAAMRDHSPSNPAPSGLSTSVPFLPPILLASASANFYPEEVGKVCPNKSPPSRGLFHV
jgi:hypothetical protein